MKHFSIKISRNRILNKLIIKFIQNPFKNKCITLSGHFLEIFSLLRETF